MYSGGGGYLIVVSNDAGAGVSRSMPRFAKITVKTSGTETVIVCSHRCLDRLCLGADENQYHRLDRRDSDIATGRFSRLGFAANYQTPDWFRDASSHLGALGPQCEPEEGDWYGANMYIPGQTSMETTSKIRPFVHTFQGHIMTGRQGLDPDKLLTFTRRTVRNISWHWPSITTISTTLIQNQPWNSVNIGPHKDLIGGWAGGAQERLRFAVRFTPRAPGRGMKWRRARTRTARSLGLMRKLTKADGKAFGGNGLDRRTLAQNPSARAGLEPDPQVHSRTRLH